MSDNDFIDNPVLKPLPLHTADELIVKLEDLIVGAVTFDCENKLLEMKIDHDTIKALAFPQPIPIFKGDSITVYILKGNRDHLISSKDFDGRVYTKRDFKPREYPTKIEKMKNGELLATYKNNNVL